MSDAKDWAAIFRETFAGPASPTEAMIARAVLGDEYPEGLDTYSYVSRSELRRIAHEVRVGAGETLVDLACGRGGPGLLVAAQTGARLIGLDISDTAVEAARARARATSLDQQAEFGVGTFEDTGLHTAAADALMSIDSLLFSPDKRRAITEMARVCRPGGRLVFTSWDYHSQPRGRPPQVDDHRPLLRDAGFDVLAYDETEGWRERQRRDGELLLEHIEDLAAEDGADPDVVRAAILEMNATIETQTRRFLAVAVRR
jgi:SAM-dependent methyltransferase